MTGDLDKDRQSQKRRQLQHEVASGNLSILSLIETSFHLSEENFTSFFGEKIVLRGARNDDGDFFRWALNECLENGKLLLYNRGSCLISNG